MTDDELKALVASLAVSQKETNEQMKRNDERINERMNRTDEQMKRTDEKLKSIGIQLGNMSKNQGDIAEAFFYNSLIKNLHLGDLPFDDIAKNMEKHRGNIQEEYDLLLTNGNAIAVIEVKYKIHINDLDKLDRKIANLKKLFPIYQDYKLYGAMASFHFNDDARQATLDRGYFVIERCGDLIKTENDYLKVA